MAGRTKALRTQTRLVSGRTIGDVPRVRELQMDGGRTSEHERAARRECQRRRFATVPSRASPADEDLITLTAGVGGPYYNSRGSYDNVADIAELNLSHVQGVYTGDENMPVFAHDDLLRRVKEEGELGHLWPSYT